ncbi:MAG: ATP-binding cassette domain-containing protein, partial [Dehalococcoidia bacterium]
MEGDPSVRGNKRDEGDGDAPALSVEGLYAWYNHKPVLKDVTFSVERGAMVGVVGPNGAGKSTLFKAILGLHKGWRGAISIFGGEARSNKRLMGYTPQIELVDWDFPLRVFDVVLMGRYGKLGLFRRPRG